MNEEKWKDIKGYEGFYQVSTLGRVRSLDIEKEYHPIGRKSYKKILKGKILKSYIHSSGYMVVILYKDCERVIKFVNRLVAEAFLENPDGYRFVKFKDGDVCNVEVSNLTWSGCSNKVI